MTRLGSTAAAGLIVSALVAGMAAAAAEPAMPADPFIQRVFAKPLGDEKIYACFIRRYDAAHLAQHPKQKVNSMKVLAHGRKERGG
jgi:hypothetical protein